MFQFFDFQPTHILIAVACTSFVGVIVGASVTASSETATKVLGAINAGCFLYLGAFRQTACAVSFHPILSHFGTLLCL
jgi:hypothetical protein